MSATPGDAFYCGRQRPVLRFKPTQFALSIDSININDENARGRAGRNADIELGILLPPTSDRVQIVGGSLDAISRGRALVTWLARKNVQPFSCQRQRAPDHGAASERDI